MRPRRFALPLLAIVAVAATIGVQLANGGGRYEPLEPPSACQDRTVAPESTGIEGLTESLVLTGLAEAACDLGVSREELTLELAQQEESPTDAQVTALRSGLLAAVERMKDDGTLPKTSDLLDEALTNADLNPLLERGIRLLPDGVIDSAVQLDDVLARAIRSLDVRDLLENLDDQAAIEDAVNQAVTQAVRDSIIARVRGLLP